MFQTVFQKHFGARFELWKLGSCSVVVIVVALLSALQVERSGAQVLLIRAVVAQLSVARLSLDVC